ncbi:nuclease-related domain-containing protein [Bacillus sp. REN10]|uniref:nuclease-related domain-containing protein n=1 Tax=Bacillus sp. REN10 TaxID=2782541 RepID=UPI00193B3DF9|nr:nuclease-related domain-containing protein [Bacillus sp. REN10]
MIVKQRIEPLSLQQLQVLERRLPPHHVKKEAVVDCLTKEAAGYKGEKSLDYPLSLLPPNDYQIFHDLRLFEQMNYFQLDTLIVTRQFLLILEVKNYYGTLIFDSNFHQMTRLADGKEEGFPDPLLQVNRQKEQLKRWLSRHGYEDLPIQTFVVISQPRTIIKASAQVAERIIHSASLPLKIQQLEMKHPFPIIDFQHLSNLSHQLLNSHCPLRTDILKKFHISPSELITGVQCPSCSSLPMIRRQRKWFCPRCEHTSKDAHLSALKDYSLLIGKIISNRQARDFLQISSEHIAKKLLKSTGLPYSGQTKARKYHLQFDES